MGVKSFNSGTQRVHSDDKDMEDSLSSNVNSSASKELEPSQLHKDALALLEEDELPILEHSKDDNVDGSNVLRDVIIANEDPARPRFVEDDAKETNGLLSSPAVIVVIRKKVGADDSKSNDDASSVSITAALFGLFNKIRMKHVDNTDVWTLDEFISTANILTLRQLCANLEHMHTFDPGGDARQILC